MSFCGIVPSGNCPSGNYLLGNCPSGKSPWGNDPLGTGLITLLEVLKEWANPIDHRESLIYISSCVEASRTLQNDLISSETVGLE